MKGKKIEYSYFKKFIGKWNTEGRLLNSNENEEVKIKGTDTYELILDGFFILHKADVLIGKQRSRTHEIIGVGTRNNFLMQHFNNNGTSGSMTATRKYGTWSYNGNGLRFRGKFSKKGNEFSGVWEQRSRSKWTDFIEIKLSKKN
jgi:hypothetical protein